MPVLWCNTIEWILVEKCADPGERPDCLQAGFLWKDAQKGRKNMIQKHFPAQVDALDEVLGFTEEELEKCGASMKTIMQISVCVEELFVNIAHYAYEGRPEEGAMLTIEASDGEVSLTLTDSGMAFDPLAREDPDVTLPAEKREIGGLGIYMVKQTMDDVTYRRENEKNILTIKKKL